MDLSEGILNYQFGDPGTDLTIGATDRVILRRLAGQVAELAVRSGEQCKRELWYRHNALQPTRPLVICDPDDSWNEVIPSSELECEGERARRWERALRQEIFAGDCLCDDRVIMPEFAVQHVYVDSDWGLRETQRGGRDGGTYAWEPALASYCDMHQLRFSRIILDAETSERVLELAQEVLGDLLTVRLRNSWPIVGMTWNAILLRGATQFMLDMIDHPEELHQLMAFLRDGYLARLDFLQENDLFSLNNDGVWVGTGAFGWSRELPQPDFTGHVRTCDLWGVGESQETTAVSPEMFAEFVFPYQLPFLERFGLNCYGCCEPLEGRWQFIEQVPRLRRVSVPPWSNCAIMAELLQDRYVYSLKPNPADLALSSFDEERIRGDLRAKLRITRDCRVEVVMKDVRTVRNDPSRLTDWVCIARQEAESA